MRIHLHDGSGHPFQVQLSRALAARGHEVVHSYATQFVSGRGRLEVTPDDPATLRIIGITAGREMVKYSPIPRTLWELSYAKAWQQVLKESPADVVISCNTQLFVAARMRHYFARTKQPWILWHQDIASMALADEAARRLPGPVSAPIGAQIGRMERALVRDAGWTVAIGDQFLAKYREWGLPTDHVDVIANWAPIDEITPRERDNQWSRRVGLAPSGIRLLYAGTLGRKHNPMLLLDLVNRCRELGMDASLVVCSEGVGADELTLASVGMPFVRILPFQAAEDLPDVLGSGDVLLTLLEPEASQFSIPSKVLSYLAAGRPTLTMVPASNPCVADVLDGGGQVVSPDAAGIEAGAQWIRGLAADDAHRRELGQQARQLADRKFNIDLIVARFEVLCESLVRQVGI